MAINVPKEYEVPLYLFHQGKNAEAYKLFGSHFAEKDGVSGVVFRVWAPRAYEVRVVGDFSSWTDGILMRKISQCTHHLVIIFHAVYAVILRQTVLDLLRQRIIRRITESQDGNTSLF